MFTKRHLSCPCGKSSDAFAIDEKGAGYCFSGKCTRENKFFSKEELNEMDFEPNRATNNSESTVTNSSGKGVSFTSNAGPIPERKINLSTAKHYQLTVYDNGEGKESTIKFPYYSADGKFVGWKVRKPEKRFYAEGDITKGVLFGQQLDTRGNYITITEGELDALAVFQMNASKGSVVSIKNGAATAKKECQENWEFLNQFEKVYICFDADEPGQKAAKEVANLFPGKAYIVNLKHYKDACDYLVNNDTHKFVKAWWNAPLHTEANVLMGEALLEELNRPILKGRSLIWPNLSDMTQGVRMHELWTFGAGSGMGKTEIFKELAYGLAADGQKVGMILLEEPPSRTIQSLVGKHINKRIYLEEVESNREEQEEAIDLLIKSNNVVIYDHKGTCEFSEVRNKILYFVKALGVKYIFLDHITAMAEGKLSDEGSVNTRCHFYMQEFYKLLQEDEFTIFLVSHLRKTLGKPYEEGGHISMDDLYGSGAIKQRSHFVFSFEGDMQNEDPAIRNTRILRCLKDRDRGKATGRSLPLQFIHKTGRLQEYEGTLDGG